ncbi:MAG: hypothetical protein ACREOV_08025, partial [Candidatus Dormibacteraceae bacterium]
MPLPGRVRLDWFEEDLAALEIVLTADGGTRGEELDRFQHPFAVIQSGQDRRTRSETSSCGGSGGPKISSIHASWGGAGIGSKTMRRQPRASNQDDSSGLT